MVIWVILGQVWVTFPQQWMRWAYCPKGSHRLCVATIKPSFQAIRNLENLYLLCGVTFPGETWTHKFTSGHLGTLATPKTAGRTWQGVEDNVRCLGTFSPSCKGTLTLSLLLPQASLSLYFAVLLPCLWGQGILKVRTAICSLIDGHVSPEETVTSQQLAMSRQLGCLSTLVILTSVAMLCGHREMWEDGRNPEEQWGLVHLLQETTKLCTAKRAIHRRMCIVDLMILGVPSDSSTKLHF